MSNLFRILVIGFLLFPSFTLAQTGDQPKFARQIRQGMSGLDVRELQGVLGQDLSVYPDRRITGYYGPLTERAVRAYQKKHGLPITGAVDSTTLTKLNGVADESNERYIIRFKQQPGNAEQALLEKASARVNRTFSLVPAISARVPKTALSGLANNPNIESIELDKKVHVSNTELRNSWGVERIGAGTVHANGITGRGIKVAILDTGIDYTHPELQTLIAGGYNFIANNDNPMDDNGHGTHVAGVIAAASNNTGVVGVVPQVQLYVLKVLDEKGSGNSSDIIAALEWAVERGIHITNNSYGTSQDPGSTVALAFANAEKAGILNIAAAGNSGNCSGDADTVEFPARYASVVAVAASDSTNSRPCFSSTGNTIELTAPGVSINSTHIGGNYAVFSGTSMAAPHVAGTAASVAHALVSLGKVPSNNTIRQILSDTAFDLGAEGRDGLYGYGLVKADQAVSSALESQLDPVEIPQTEPDESVETIEPSEPADTIDNAFPLPSFPSERVTTIPVVPLPPQAIENRRIPNLPPQARVRGMKTETIFFANSTIFSRDLKFGMIGDDVKELQKFLNANSFVLTENGPGSPGLETTIFGSATQEALIRFQKAYNISPSIGYFGTITREVIHNR